MVSKAKKLYPFKYVGAHKLFTEERFLLADEMGMFKTAQAILANSKFRERKSNLRTLIVCPTSVREHWARELQEWAGPGEINPVYSDNLDQGMSRSAKADWTIMTYPLMSRFGKDIGQTMKNTGFHHVIADEVHNAKNPDAFRTKALKALVDQADYASLLSGTPIPNTMSDLYVLMSMLDPANYPFDPEKDSSDSKNFRIARQSFIQLYVERPQAVKELLHRKMLKRSAEDFVGQHLPEAHYHRIEVPLTGVNLETYQSVLEADVHVGKKIMDLTKASLDPCLVNPSLNRLKNNGRDISNKYDFLDDIVAREMEKKDGKVLAFSNLKTGVIDYLVDSYSSFGAVGITGDISANNGVRETMRKRFQHDPNTRIMLATTTMNEGVDLTAATAIVHLTIPLTPAQMQQRGKRSHRPGEIKKDRVDIYTPFTTTPGSQASLDESLLEMLDSKVRTVEYLTKGIQVSLEELKHYDKAEKIPTITRAITSPSKAVFKYYLRWRGLGAKGAQRRRSQDLDVSKYTAELYPHFSMAKNAADIYVPIIKKIEKRKSLENKVDIACGPGMLGYFLDEPTTGIDINPDMLEVGRKLHPKNTLYEGRMDDLLLEDKSTDLTVCSLAYQMAAPKTERPKALMEMSRVLKKGGYSIITIPQHYMTPGEEKRFEEVAGKYGFEVKDHRKELGKSKIDVYVFKKIKNATTDKTYNLRWKGDPGRKKK